MPISIPNGQLIGKLAPEGITIYNPMFWRATMESVDTHGRVVEQSQKPQVKKFTPQQVATRKNRQPQRNINLMPGSLEESFNSEESFDLTEGYLLNI